MENDAKSDNKQPGSDQTKPDENLEMYTPEPNEEQPEPAADNNEDKASETKASNKPKADENIVHWQASEYIHGEKNLLWYVIFAIVVIATIVLDLLLVKSYTITVLAVVMAAVIVVYTRRPPKTIDYALSAGQGLYVGEKLYSFGDFKSFGLIRDGEHHSIMMIPIKRFDPGVSVYFPEEAGEKIVDILGSKLPMEELKLDAVDVVIRKLRL